MRIRIKDGKTVVDFNADRHDFGLGREGDGTNGRAYASVGLRAGEDGRRIELHALTMQEIEDLLLGLSEVAAQIGGAQWVTDIYHEFLHNLGYACTDKGHLPH